MTKILAHRGANRAAPQNTIPAFLKAIEMGAHGVENDVHLTADGRLVIVHDYEIDNMSNGKGKVSDYTLEELKGFDFGSYFSPDFEGTRIPTLEEFLDIADPFEIINIEIKSPEKKGTDIVGKTVEAVKAFGLLDRLIISSFDADLLTEVKGIDSKIKTGLLYSPDSPIIEKIFDDPFGFAKSIKADALHPFCFYVDEEYIETAHKNGFIVNPWCVNLPAGIKAMDDWGCDGIITDVPDVCAQTLK